LSFILDVVKLGVK